MVSIGVSKAKAAEFLEALNKTFEDYHMDSCLKRAHFLAQVIHESGGFNWTTEIGVAETAYGGFSRTVAYLNLGTLTGN